MGYPRPSTNPAAGVTNPFGPAADVSPSRAFRPGATLLDFWARDDTFRASIAQRDDRGVGLLRRPAVRQRTAYALREQ